MIATPKKRTSDNSGEKDLPHERFHVITITTAQRTGEETDMTMISSPVRYAGAYDIRIHKDDQGEFTTVEVSENRGPTVEFFRFMDDHPMNREGVTDEAIVRYVMDKLHASGRIARRDGMKKDLKALRAKYRK